MISIQGLLVEGHKINWTW